MRLVGRIVALTLSLLAIPLFTLAACNVAIASTLFAPQTYERVIADEMLFEDLLGLALPALVEGLANNPTEDDAVVRLEEIIRVLDQQTWEDVTALLVPVEWLQARTEQMVLGVLRILEGDFSHLEEPFNVREVRARLVGEQATQAATLIITRAPECTPEQTARLERLLQGEGSPDATLPICNPQDSTLRRESVRVLIAWLRSIGEMIDAESTPSLGEFFEVTEEDARALYLLVQLDRQGLTLVYLLPLALLCLIVILAVRAVKGFGCWIGGTLAVTGATLILVLLWLQASAFNLFGAIVTTNSEVERFGARIISPLLRSGLYQASTSLLLQVGVFLGVGFLLLGIAWLSRRREETDGTMVFINQDGEVISTATNRKIGTMVQDRPTDG